MPFLLFQSFMETCIHNFEPNIDPLTCLSLFHFLFFFVLSSNPNSGNTYRLSQPVSGSLDAIIDVILGLEIELRSTKRASIVDSENTQPRMRNHSLLYILKPLVKSIHFILIMMNWLKLKLRPNEEEKPAKNISTCVNVNDLNRGSKIMFYKRQA